MADETVVVDLKVIDNMAPSIANLKELKKLLKTLPADSEAFGTVNRAISDMEDSVKSAKGSTSDFVDTLASAPGPLGALGKGLNNVKVATQSWGAAFKAIGIGAVVSLIGLLVAAFAKTEGSMKKLEPLMIAFEQILGGIVEAFQPLLESFAEFAISILPAVTDGIAAIFGGLVSFFTLLKEAGQGAGKILKGIFDMDPKAIEEGWEQIKGSWGKTTERYDKFQKDFEKGTKNITATQKKSNEEIAKLNKEAYDKLDKNLQEKTKLKEAEIKLNAAILSQIKVDDDTRIRQEQETSTKIFVLQRDSLKARIAAAQKFGQDYKGLQADLLILEANYVTATEGFGKQIQDNQRKNRETELKNIQADYDIKALVAKRDLDSDKSMLDKRLATKYYIEQEYNAKLRVLQDKFDQDRLSRALEQQTKELANAQKQKDLKLINDQEYNDLRNSIVLKANAVSDEVDTNRYNRQVQFLTDLYSLQQEKVAQEKELNNIRLDSYRSYADGISAILGYISGIQKDASEEQILLAKIAIYIQSAAAVADVILKARAAYAAYAKASATAAATVMEGVALSSNPLTLPIGAAMIAAGSAAGAAAKAGQVFSIAGAVAQTAIIAANTAMQIQAVDQAASGAGKSASSGASGGGGASTPAFSAGGSVGAPQIGASNAQTGVIAGTVAGAINANNSTMQPIKAYVVGNDITTEMQLQRRLRTMARLGG